jgi:predicted transcriptional regulator
MGQRLVHSPDAEGFSQADTAKLLNVDQALYAKDLKMAKALEVFPELKQAKTRSEADKLLKKMQENILVAEMAKRVRTKEANTPIEQLHIIIINNYIVKDFFGGS